MAKSITFTIPRLPLSLNKYSRMHWRRRYDFDHLIFNHIYAKWQDLRKPVFVNPVRIVFILSFAKARVRDFDNYIGGTKPFTDALKKTFFFRDDSEWVKGVEVKFTTGQEGTTIRIEEAE